MDETDYIIVGAGSSGCVLANRLTADPAISALLLEAGGTDWNPLIHVPMGSGKLLRSGLHGWDFRTEGSPGLNGRSDRWPRGKVLGGTSSINGQIYIRGHATDYDDWARLGAKGWSYDEVLRYFLRAEDHRSRHGPYHGNAGPLSVQQAKSKNPLYDAFIKAGVEAGFPRSEDFNGAQQEGFGRFDFTIRDGRRWSTASAYLRPARERGNLQVVTRAHVARILIEKGRATGVEHIHRGRRFVVRARREVVLCAGAIMSPQLLMLSGVGPAAELRRHGIGVIADLREVGCNLQDHVRVPIQFSCTQPLTLHSFARFDRAVLAMLRAWLLHSGDASGFPCEAGAFTRSRPGLTRPDLQWHFVNGLGFQALRWPLIDRVVGRQRSVEGFTISTCVLRPASKGRISLRSANPLDAPRIEPNFLSEATDVDALVEGVAQIREVVRSPSLAKFIRAEMLPGDAVRSRAELAQWARGCASSGYHQAGTCRMGSDSGAVVDEMLRVRALEGLRVADASIMPTLIGGNTNAPTIMIAEKAADLILGRADPMTEAPPAVAA